jgi:enediyne biosynthesis protein E4
MRKVIVGVALVAVAAGAWFAISRLTRGHEDPIPDQPAATAPAGGWFEDVAAAAGVHFRLFDPATPSHLIQETLPGGVAWIDYDGDGWPELFCVQAAPVGSQTHKLYRNNHDGTFTDVTDRVGLNVAGFGFGCAVGDYDNDGFDDLFLTYIDHVELYHNEPDATAPGGRRFVNVTAKSGLLNQHWGTSCAWGDLDGDGFLDLYVCNYVEIDPAKPIICKNEAKGLNYTCSPTAYPHTAHRLFRNNGSGTFTDVTASSGIGAAPPAPGLGVVIADFDGDGKQDIYVANDMSPGYLFKNLGNMKFEEKGLFAGVALGPGGERIAGMGIAVADFGGTSRPGLFVTNFQRSPNVLFVNRGALQFDDATYSSGLGGPSLDRLKFGTCGVDVDLDGYPDLPVANGHVSRHSKELFGVPYAQEAQLFLGEASGKFRDGSASAGADFLKARVGRGLAWADFDGDGRPDLVMSGIGDPVALLRNRVPPDNGWVALELIGDGKLSNRNAIGSVAKVEWAGKTQTHFVIGGGSYLSASDRRLHLGLGTAPKIDKVTVRWPSGKEQVFQDLPAKTRWRLREGSAAAEALVLPGK